MNRQSIQRVVALVCLSMVLLGSAVAQAQDEILVNPGFEDPFVDQGGDPARQVAEGWTAWHVPAPANAPTFMNQQPEYLPASPDTARIRNGANAQLLTSFFATYDAGVYQQVDVPQGAELTFSTYAYVWSSSFDNVDVSQNDGEMVVFVGIDPNAGTDPLSPSIVWSPGTVQYDAWQQYSVTAEAAGASVTVWIRATSAVPVKSNNVYLDDATLAVAGEAPAATETALPTQEALPTETPVPPTPTAVPTETPTDLPTATEPPPPTATDVPLEPTRVDDGGIILSTPTQEQLPTATEPPPPTATAVPTETLPPTATVTLGPTSTPLPTQTPAPTATPTLPPTLDPVFRSTVNYTVQAGDTVQRIASLYGSSPEAIIQTNNLGQSALIFVGQQLVIPVRLPPVPTLGASPTGVVLEPTATLVIVATLPPQPTAAPATINYQVQVNDTLSGIAARFNTSVAILAQLNGIVNPDRILLGQTLRIPTQPVLVATAVPQPSATPIVNVPQTHTVQAGDTLFRISIQYNVPIGQLINLNGITNPNQIFVGQVLRLQ